MDEERRSVPAKMFFKVDLDLVQTRLAESAILVATKAPIKNGGNSQSLSLSESTSETTHKSATPSRSTPDLLNKAIRESQKTGESADAILNRLRQEAGV